MDILTKHKIARDILEDAKKDKELWQERKLKYPKDERDYEKWANEEEVLIEAMEDLLLKPY
jgi:hypothetical protein